MYILIVEDWSLNEIMRPRRICLCRNVSRQDILNAVENGCDTLNKLVQKTGVTTGCSTCEPEVIRIFEKALSDKQKRDNPQKTIEFEAK